MVGQRPHNYVVPYTLFLSRGKTFANDGKLRISRGKSFASDGIDAIFFTYVYTYTRNSKIFARNIFAISVVNREIHECFTTRKKQRIRYVESKFSRNAKFAKIYTTLNTV